MSRELRNRILITIGLLFAVQFISLIPVPGINVGVLYKLFDQQLSFSFLNKLRQFSILALGLAPYLAASMLVMTVFYLLNFKKGLVENENKLHLCVIVLAIIWAAIQGNGLATFYQNSTIGFPLVTNTGIFFRFGVIISLIGGMLVTIWIAHLITKKGIGNGIILIIGLTLLNRWLPTFIDFIKQVGFRSEFNPFFILIDFFILVALIVIILLTTWRYEFGASNDSRSNNPLSIKLPILLIGVFPVFFLPNFKLIVNRLFGVNWMNQSPIMLIFHAMTIIFMAFIFTIIAYQPKRLVELRKQYFPDNSSPENDMSTRFDRRLIYIIVLYSSLLLMIWGASLLLQHWIVEELELGNLYYITRIVYLFIIIAIAADIYYQVKAHREMISYRNRDESQGDPLFCDKCNARVASDDPYCKTCGAAFSDDSMCDLHPNKAAEAFCVVCSKPLCVECSIIVNGRYRCADHKFVEIREGWVKVQVTNTFVEAQFIEKVFKENKIDTRILSNTMGSNYGAIKLWQLTPVIPFMVPRWLGGGEIKIFVPAGDYESALKLLSIK